MRPSIRVVVLRLACFILGALVLAGGSQVVAFAAGPTLTSDKLDYSPGQTVILTGTGWAPNELVKIVMTVDPATHAPVTLTAKSDDHGNLTNSNYVVQKSDLGVRFHVTGAGLTSLLTAHTTFTDTITTPTSIGQANATTAGTTLSVTVPAGGVAVGNTIIVSFEEPGTAGTVSVSDTRGNTYTSDADVTRTGMRTLVFSAPVTTALTSGNTITVTSPSVANRAVSIYYVGGLVSASPRDKSVTASGSSTSPSSGSSGTLSLPIELCWGAIGFANNGTFTVGGSFTALTKATAGTAATIQPTYLIVSTTTAQTASGTITSGSWAAALVTYKAMQFPSTATGTYTVTTSGDYVIYTFTGNGSFTPSQNLTADILVVGGGGGGGGNTSTGANGYYDVGGGGGAGGFLTPTSVSLSGGSVYTVTVGAGGTAGTPSAKGGNGGNSVFGSYTATGGGGGGSGYNDTSGVNGSNGGSGGGGGVDDWDGYIGAAGTTNGQGHNGAAGTVPYYELGGGGGGAGAPGIAQNGGNGSASGITGTSVTYAGGGGGGGGGYSAGTGGTGGGGAGGKNSAGAAGTVNTGGGGGGGSSGSGGGTYNGGAGGSGIVIVRYAVNSVWMPTAVTVRSFTATSSESGNLIKLQTGREVNNLGFNLYREQDGQRVKLNSSLLAGSALMGGAGTTFTAGHTRTWQDDLPGGSGSVAYWVEEIDLSGTSTWYGPASPDSTPPSTSAGMRSAAMRTAVSGAALRGGTPSSAPAVSLSSIGRSATTSTAAVTVAAAATATPQNLQTQWALAAGQALKLGVSSEGWYRVTQPQLVAAGFNPNVDPRRLQLYVNGVQQPILVEGQSDGKFGSQDAIDFYGMGVDTIWSDTQEYWLVAGNGPGLRISSQNKSNGSAGASSFPFSVQWKPRTVYFAALLNGDGNNFFGPVLDSTDPLSQVLTITHLNTGAGGSSPLQVTLQGGSAGAHAVTVTLNGNFVGNMAFSDQNSSTSSFLVRNSYLHEGANTLGLTVKGGAADVSVVDTVLLTYPHSYIADSNSLRLTAASGKKVTVSGFSGSSVQVIDITNPSSVSLVPGTVSAGTVAFVPQGGGTRTLLAVASSQFASPASITENQGSSWHSAQAGADMVIISHGDFIDSLTPLVALRQSQGLKVAVVDVEDLYDEFNFGVESPYAIRSFLSAAKANWSTKPAYVLLMGNGTFDPRNYLGTTVPDLVPAKLVDTNLLETASDDWFVDFNNDGIPEMAIGRLPARTEDQAAAMVNKIVAYEQAGAGGWKDNVLLVAGQNDAENDFEAYTYALLGLLPGTVSVTEIFQGSPTAHTDLENSINNIGVGLVNYIGHGSTEIWAGGLLSSTDALALINGSNTPVVIAMTCLNGYFQDVYTNSLAEALMNAPGGGAVAVWASSGLTESGPQSAMDQALIRVLYGSQPVTLGEAAASAKEAVSDQDVRKTWILFGDPAMKVR